MNKLLWISTMLLLTIGLSAQEITSASHVFEFNIANQVQNAEGIQLNKNGTKVFVINRLGTITEYILSTPFSLASIIFNKQYTLPSSDGFTTDLCFNETGTKLFTVGRTRDNVHEYNLSTAFEPSSASFIRIFGIKGQENSPQGLTFSSTGTRMFLVGNNGKDINAYQLSEPYNISTASFDQNFSISRKDAFPTSLSFNEEGTVMYVLGSSGGKIYQYNLSSAYNIKTANFTNSITVGGKENNPTGIAVANSNHIFIVGKGNFTIQQYDFNDTNNQQDNDGDNVLSSQDCNDNDPNLTSTGAACDDGNPNTNNDKVTANCTCEGTINDPDNDGDNVPASQDCNDNDPNLTTTAAACDDGNPNTNNDKVTANCTCEGTINDPDNDGDNVPASLDCNDNNPNLTSTGATCDDGNPNTINDIVTTSCTCQGTPTGGSNTTIWTDQTSHISTNQKVLIGATSNLPDGYNLFVEEGILAKKMKLALPNTSAWADYVFEENYDLRLSLIHI